MALIHNLPKYGEQSVFDWRQQPIAGVTFNVYANKDIIVAPDADGNVRGYQKAEDLVATLTTGEGGMATTGDLYLGEYRMVEVSAPDGFIINTNEQIIALEYQ
ncbi:prealbumin-like fold domain-containing protein [Eubacterium aggregans]|uniref:prealbumin-like fold domain-containing protein n=1 Tax=Eubacterium aggregans TaxID=81409 RepID=UPI003F3F4D78